MKYMQIMQNMQNAPNIQNMKNIQNMQRDVIWWDPPYSINFDTNFGAKFFVLIDKCFPMGTRAQWIRSKLQIAISTTKQILFIAVTLLQIWLWKLQISIFVCLFTCLFVPHVLPISQEENGPIIIPKTVLKSGLWRRSESGCGIFNLKLLCFSLHSSEGGR